MSLVGRACPHYEAAFLQREGDSSAEPVAEARRATRVEMKEVGPAVRGDNAPHRDMPEWEALLPRRPTACLRSPHCGNYWCGVPNALIAGA